MQSRLKQTRTASFCSTDLEELSCWSEKEKRELCLTIWLGSTHMTIALCPAHDPKKTIYLNKILVSTSEQVMDNFENLRNSLGNYQCQVAFTTMSFAGPVSSDNVVLTNWKCEAREKVIHFMTLPFDLFPLDRRLFINDLEAASYGIISRNLHHNLHLIFTPLSKLSNKIPQNNVPVNLDKSSLVLSIGNGFGTSYICMDDAADNKCVLSSEAGHSQAYQCSVDSPYFDFETRLFQYVALKNHSGAHQPEWEDFCAIRGLEMIYQFIKHEKGEPEGKTVNYETIKQLALRFHDVDALEAFKTQYRFVLRAAQSLVLAIKCQRVFLISEFQVQNFEIMKILKDELLAEFNDHPRKSWLKGIPIYIQHETSSFALSGGLFLSRSYAVTSSHQMRDF